jgi:hypothetical protein
MSKTNSRKGPDARWDAVFTAVLCLTVLSLLVCVGLSVGHPQPPEHVKRVIDACETTFKLGFGALIGLIGGRVLSRGA